MRKQLAVSALLLVAGCVAAPEPPQPPPPIDRPPPPAPPAPPPVAATSDWRDWPLTPGNWSYTQGPNGTLARFSPGGGPPLLTLRCDRASRQVELARLADPRASAPDLTVRTSSTVRVVPARPRADNYLSAVLPANDPLLDAMGFSRGRFVIQQPGGANLVVPAWAEILRVAEDCRG